jgi:hypothetical protein
MPPTHETADDAMAWSPDRRWLVIAQDGKLLTFDVSTGGVTGLGFSCRT